MPKGIKPRLGLHGAPHGNGGNAFLKKISKPRPKELAKGSAVGTICLGEQATKDFLKYGTEFKDSRILRYVDLTKCLQEFFANNSKRMQVQVRR